MRLVLATLTKCWILIQSQSNTKEGSDLDSDEGGPLRKQRRLTLDHWTAVATTMDRLRKEHSRRTGRAGPLQTRDVGVLCSSERVPVNDKCIMVGTTGIAALKAEYGDDFTNFEIIQDVGYSSESSTHLSGDDTTGLDNSHHWTMSNVRFYNYTSKDHPPMAIPPISLREELESVARLRDFHYSLGSSLESSSLDDSGLGTGEALTTGESGDVQLIGQFTVDEEEDDYEQEELDYLETVLDECVDFGANAVSDDPEELHFNLSGLDSDSSDNFHNRSSFTTSAQVFYKMISVDSDNGDADNTNNEHNINNHSSSSSDDNNNNLPTENRPCSTTATTDISPPKSKDHTKNDKDLCRNFNDNTNKTCNSTSDSDPETFKPVQSSPSVSVTKDACSPKASHRMFCSTPKLDSYRGRSSSRPSLKRKRGYSDSLDTARMSGRIRSWLNRCSDFSRRPSSRTSQGLHASEDLSSCDASSEGTTSSSSSSADEGCNIYSSRSSQNDDQDVFRLRSKVDSSAQGSVETVLQALLMEDSDCPFLLLPPPPSSTASSFGSNKNFGSSTVYGGSTRRLKKQERRTKASSDGDIEKLKSSSAYSGLSTQRMLRKLNSSKPNSGSGHRLHSSLPTVLSHFSDSSTDDNFVTSTLPSHSETKATSGSINHSSSSEIGKRRRRRSRKKSSSSNRSSTSLLYSGGDAGRHRSRTLTSSTSRCGSRRRHRSQRSDFYCPDVVSSDEGKEPLKVEIPPVEENAGFDDLRRASSVLLSPAESDIVLTQLEEQSTVSDQVWDGYQEMPYLSEGYSEATVDEEAVRKLTEFGDDYGSAIGQPVRLLEPPGSNISKTESPKKCSKTIPVTARLSSLSDDSDSDVEDLCYVIDEAAKALHFARDILQRRKTGEPLTPANYAELLATCGTHLRCLQTICKHIDGQEHKFSASHLKQLHYLIEQWQELQRNTEMFEKSEHLPAQQKYLQAQENIDALYNKMSELASCSYLKVESFTSWEDVDKNMTRLQMVLTSLQESKEQLLSVNLQVHRFTTEYSEDENYKDCSLKDDVTELYRQWEDTYEQNGAHLTELEALKADWKVYNEKLQQLRLRLKETEFGTNEDNCDNTAAGTISTEKASLRKDLGELERCAALLESRLKGGDAWKAIEEELRSLKRRIHGEESSPQRNAFLSANHRSPSSRIEEDADDHFEDAIQQLCVEDADTLLANPQKKDSATNMAPKRTKGRFWRIVRFAVPVQFALVLLYCLACYLEPSCCNALNNFNFSFTPQLRYLGGKPPV